jgi:hypothetical protein
VWLMVSVALEWQLNRRFNQYAKRRREAGSRSIWFKRIGYASDDYSRRNQIHKALQRGIAIVALAAIGSTWGFGEGGNRLPGGWVLWVRGTVTLYVLFLMVARPWSAASRSPQMNIDHLLSPETESWLAGGPLPPSSDITRPPSNG